MNSSCAEDSSRIYRGVTILGSPGCPRGSSPARPSILDIESLQFSVQLLPALQCVVGHDGRPRRRPQAELPSRHADVWLDSA